MGRKKGREIASFLLMFIAYYGANALFWEFFVVYLTQAGYSATFAGSVMTATYLLNLVVQPLVGYCSDRLGSPRKILLSFGILLLPSTFLIMHSIKVPPLLLFSVGYLSILDNPMCALLDSYAVREQERLKIPYGTIRASGSFGYAVALITGGSLSRSLGFGAAFFLRTVLMGVMVIVLMLQPQAGERSFAQFKQEIVENSLSGKLKREEQTHKKSVQRSSNLFVLLKSREYGFVLVVIFLYQAAVRVFATFSPILIQELGGDNGTIGWIGGFGCFVQIPVMILAGRRAKETASVKLYRPVFFLLILRCMIIWIVPSIGSLFLGTVLQQAAGALSTVISVQLLYQASPKASTNTAIAAGQAVTGAAAMLVGNLLGGIVTDCLSPLAIVWLSGAFSFGGLVLAALPCRSRKLDRDQ